LFRLEKKRENEIELYNEFLGMDIYIYRGRGVHGSVRFGSDPKNQPNRITLIL